MFRGFSLKSKSPQETCRKHPVLPSVATTRQANHSLWIDNSTFQVGVPAGGPSRIRKPMVYYTLLYYTILYYTILYYTILYYTMIQYGMIYYTILYYTILYYII